MQLESRQPFAPSIESRGRVAALRSRLREGPSQGPLNASVVGVGASGRAAADLLAARGCAVKLVDDRSVDRLDPEARAWLKDRPLFSITRDNLRGSDLVVLSPGVPRAREELSESIEAGRLVGEVELASWMVSVPLAGITGTNGKSTTTALVAHIMRKSGRAIFAGGNLGEPLSHLARSRGDVSLAVVELSSYQLESIVDAQFRVACWLNLTADHTDRYPSLEVYAAAKQRLIERRSIGGSAVLNAHDPVCARAGLDLGGTIRWFSTSATSSLARRGGTRLVADEQALRVGRDGREERYDLRCPALIGLHNKANALAAIECARALDAAPENVQSGLSTFEGLPHRLEWVSTIGDVRYYNDSKATNVDSAVTAVEAVSGPIHLIAGGQDKGGSWSPLVERANGRIKRVYAIGEAADIVAKAFASSSAEVVRAEVLARAVEYASADAKPGEVVLLSPACASFDQYRNYAERGAAFVSLVKELEAAS